MEYVPDNYDQWEKHDAKQESNSQKQEPSISFSVQGEFITTLAREKCHLDGNLKCAVELLESCLMSDTLSDDDIRDMAMAILDGRAEIRGTYPSDDYEFRYLPVKDDKWDLGNLILDKFNKIKTVEKECKELQQKYLFILDDMGTEEWKLRRLNTAYQEEYDKPLFENIAPPEPESFDSSLLDSFMKRQMSDTKDDYGWLEPDGTFHPVEWGDHQEFAYNYLKEHLSEDEYESIGYGSSYAGDYLIAKHWVLLHNPSQGMAIATKSPTHVYTKAQKEFLYNYYTQRGCDNEANALYVE